MSQVPPNVTRIPIDEFLKQGLDFRRSAWEEDYESISHFIESINDEGGLQVVAIEGQIWPLDQRLDQLGKIRFDTLILEMPEAGVTRDVLGNILSQQYMYAPDSLSVREEEVAWWFN